MTNSQINTILFDLDGTLLDTAPDLTAALNAVLNYYRKKAVSIETIEPVISQGCKGIICRGFNIETHHPCYMHIKQQFLCAYQQTLIKHTQPYPGILALLEYLNKHDFTWGIVTSKPGWLAIPLLNYFAITNFHCLITAEMLIQRKPHPQPLQYACQITNSNPYQTVYLGDARTDIQAAQAAHLISAIASYGYIGKNSKLSEWGANYIVKQPQQIMHYL